jgi:hypothetical protein
LTNFNFLQALGEIVEQQVFFSDKMTFLNFIDMSFAVFTCFVNMLSKLLRSPWRDLRDKGDLGNEKILYIAISSAGSLHKKNRPLSCSSSTYVAELKNMIRN